jgi:hypothetical protein
VLLVSSCGPTGPWSRFLPKKTYSSDIGIPGVPVAPGELAGTWYGQMEFATIITLPLVGAQNAGANGGRLLTITWDAARETYVVENRWCWDDVFEVQGTQNSFTNEALHALRASRAELHVDGETGHVWMDQVVDLWGVQNLPDPANTPLPNKDSYQNSPQSDWMLDEDSDGHPGVTVHIAGNFNGEGYIVNRSVFAPDGVARSVNDLVGLLKVSVVEQKLLDSTVRIAGQTAGDTDQVPDPDPKASWFQMVRGRDGATCDDVLAAKGNSLGRRPF